MAVIAVQQVFVTGQSDSILKSTNTWYHFSNHSIICNSPLVQ